MYPSESTSIKGLLQGMIAENMNVTVIRGRVTSVYPLVVTAINDDKLVINENIICLPRHLTDYMQTCDIILSNGMGLIDSQTGVDGEHMHGPHGEHPHGKSGWHPHGESGGHEHTEIRDDEDEIAYLTHKETQIEDENVSLLAKSAVPLDEKYDTIIGGGHKHPDTEGAHRHPKTEGAHKHPATKESRHSHAQSTFNVYNATIIMHNALKLNEIVWLLSFNQGKKYYILDREEQ